MTLEEYIDDIRNQLKQGAFPNEAAVSLSIVLRLLQALEWPIFKPKVVIPEYPVEGGKVDFALCPCSPEKPLVFIEVKQVRNLDGAEKQLFKYVSHKEVPVAILTDGWEWHFFSFSGQGDYIERRVCKLDLIENDRKECANRLNRYLDYEAVQIGKVVEAIEDDYENASNSLKKNPVKKSDCIFTAIARRKFKHARLSKEDAANKLGIGKDELEEAIISPIYDAAICTELRYYGKEATTKWLNDYKESPQSRLAGWMWISPEKAEEILQKVFPEILNETINTNHSSDK